VKWGISYYEVSVAVDPWDDPVGQRTIDEGGDQKCEKWGGWKA
jgi:hypothetical protein